ncbi:MAG: hypothetical protein CMH26_05805 [Micavibrio sp.]|mgnify:CR=1 FL=1|nr:hypothetical protein [Micavibrio sp.]|tara:strand:+ start:113 stop:502 length:390 start_codon:yes stop_codon:yes gene_type:complete
MKTLILIIATISANFAFATTAEYQKCTPQDMRVLEQAHSRFTSLNQVIREELLPAEERCMVSKPRNIFPAVCGIRITQIDTFRFLMGRNGSSFETEVDSSYISCHDMSALIIPEIRSMKFIDPVILPNM